MPSYRSRTLTEHMPTFRVTKDVKNRVVGLLSEDEDLGAFCRAALAAEIVRRTTFGNSATLGETKTLHR